MIHKEEKVYKIYKERFAICDVSELENSFKSLPLQILFKYSPSISKYFFE